ncbi:class I SAM-dependent methyltransferase [Draconibacterium mangrovi]|uniref:class I SAM-dependent methyltransferase n=1 Tax=Draconibacterium mangrovi TaxID=2697469 RepID=UPI0013D88A89|nr:class I SAM-dependent methyltransferase [Draconibacterium mangrovi]
MPNNMNWLDVGCGTGALSNAIEQNCAPHKTACVDASEGYIEEVKKRLSGKCDCKVGNVEKLPFSNDNFDAVVSGLAFNFFPNPDRALAEMRRVAKSNRVVAAYVWDYSDRMDLLRYFWDAACKVDPKSRDYDEGLRFTICNTANLSREFKRAGLKEVESTFLDIETVFMNFEDYWNPFFSGQGPAPGFLMSLSKKLQDELKQTIQQRINYESDGSIKLTGRAIVVKGSN